VTVLESQIRDVFEAIADGDQPPPDISIAAARQRGRSLLRWRRARMAGPPVLAVSAVAAVVLASALPFGRSNPASQPRTERSRAAQGTAPARFDPLVVYGSFGWLPAGESLSSGQTGRTEEVLDATSGRHLRWQLAIFAADRCVVGVVGARPSSLLCNTAVDGTQTFPLGSRAPAVNGHDAFWIRPQPGGAGQHQSLAWQYAAGGWAVLTSAIGIASTSSLPEQIAGEVSFGGAGRSRIEFAIQLTKTPPDWQVSSVTFGRGGGVLAASGYSVTKGSIDIPPGDGYASDNMPIISTLLRKGTCYFYPGGQSVRRVIDGYQATVNEFPAAAGRPPTYQVCVGNAGGLWAFITVAGRHPAAKPVTIFKHMKILGTNPANWTTKPLAS
jgi:hypothetical protein